MNSINLKSVIFFIIIVSFPFPGQCQGTDHESFSDPQILIPAAKEIMNEAGTCALITLDEDGSPRARTMDPFAPESDLTVWFGTNPNSRKVSQIKGDPRVTLYYLAPDESGYVTIQGVAQLVDDPEQLENRWKEEWEPFYPDWPEGYLLIKVSPRVLEVVSYPHGLNGDSITWQPPGLEF